MTDDQLQLQRERFQAWISAPPFEHMCDRNSEQSAWPGQYKRYETELAWEAWQAALSANQPVIEAAQDLIDVLDEYQEQLVPINRKSATVNKLRRKLLAWRDK